MADQSQPSDAPILHPELSTAEGASRFRALQALHFDPPAFDDQWAVHLLPAHERESLAGPAGRDELFARPATWAISGVGIGSLRFADDTVAAAVRDGIDQYVILGAGFDTFAMRHPNLAGVLEVFEVDHPRVQDLKRERLRDAPAFPLKPHYVPVDFETDGLTDRLRQSGYDTSRPAVFSWMNTLNYLTLEAIDATLGELATLAAPRSQLTCNYPCRGVPTTPAQAAILESVATNVIRRGEPWRSQYEPAEFVALLDRHGFEVVEHLTEDDINRRYFADRTDSFRAGVPVRLVRALRR